MTGLNEKISTMRSFSEVPHVNTEFHNTGLRVWHKSYFQARERVRKLHSVCEIIYETATLVITRRVWKLYMLDARTSPFIRQGSARQNIFNC